MGHSSVEDSVASLDLVKWFVLDKKTKSTTVTAGVGAKVARDGGGGSGGSGSGGTAPISKM
jgi:RNA exonuclease 1